MDFDHVSAGSALFFAITLFLGIQADNCTLGIKYKGCMRCFADWSVDNS